MSRGLSAIQQSILQFLNEEDEMVSTKALKNIIGNDISKQSFYRSLNSLEKRGLILWKREHGRRKSPSGLICLNHSNVPLEDADELE